MHRTAARKGLLRPLPPMDLPFLVLVLTLVAFGLVMLCSASSAVALTTYKGNLYHSNCNSHFSAPFANSFKKVSLIFPIVNLFSMFSNP